MIENLIIGAGPAGIQMGHLLKKDYLIVEKGPSPCSFFRTFPRQRRFISINKSRELRYDWNSFLGSKKSLRDYTEEVYPSADKYLEYVTDFVNENNINIRFGFEVTKIEKVDDIFIINGGEIKAKRVFFGIGLKPKDPPSDVKVHPDVQVFTYQNMPLDPEVYRGKEVNIVGTGNAALETADYIEPWTDNTGIWGNERKAWTTHYPGHSRSVNFRAIDSYHLKARTVFHFGDPKRDFKESQKYKELKKILEGERYVDLSETIVIWCTGFEFNSSLVKDLVEVDKFPLLTCNFESTKCPELFFIGSATQHHDYKKGTSAFIHGFRYNCDYLHKYLTNSILYTFLDTPDKLVNKIFHQLNNSSVLFHRFDYFCDLIGIDSDGFHYIHEIPVQAVDQFVQKNWIKHFTIRLGYSYPPAETIQQTVSVRPRDAVISPFIHPIIHYNSLTFHISEESLNNFLIEKIHIRPFTIYLRYILGHLSLDEVKMQIEEISDPKGRDSFLIQNSL